MENNQGLNFYYKAKEEPDNELSSEVYGPLSSY